MRIIYHDVEQRTDEWLGIRRGHITASPAEHWAARTKKSKTNPNGEFGEKAMSYILEKTAERIAGGGWSMPTYVSPDMVRGTEMEPEALAAYSVKTGNIVEPVGIFEMNSEDLILLASPDGLVNDDGCVEAKCPRANVIMKYWDEGIPEAYLWQMELEMLCSQREWCDFIAYCPAAPNACRLYIERIYPDPDLRLFLLDRALEVEAAIVEKHRKIGERLQNAKTGVDGYANEAA